MKRSLLLILIVVIVVSFMVSGSTAQMMGQGGYGAVRPGMVGQGGYGQWNYCPYCGQPLGQGAYGMQSGMMMAPGMMGRGMMGMMGRGMMGSGMMSPGMAGPGQGMGHQGSTVQQKQLTVKEARSILENYIKSTRNPNLKVGKIKDKGDGFEAEIVTKKEGALVDKIFVDKYTGWMRSVY